MRRCAMGARGGGVDEKRAVIGDSPEEAAASSPTSSAQRWGRRAARSLVTRRMLCSKIAEEELRLG